MEKMNDMKEEGKEEALKISKSEKNDERKFLPLASSK
jgi:hypothetical protein